MLPSLSVRVIRAPEGSPLSAYVDSKVLLKDLLNGRVGVMDLWHSKCTKCPAALEKFDSLAESFSDKDVLFVACALSQGDGDLDMVSEFMEE